MYPLEGIMPPLLTIKEVAAVLEMPERKVFELINEGEFVAIKIGGITRIPRNQVQSILDAKKLPHISSTININ
jgi:excisionase family DNA binding protein